MLVDVKAGVPLSVALTGLVERLLGRLQPLTQHKSSDASQMGVSTLSDLLTDHKQAKVET